MPALPISTLEPVVTEATSDPAALQVICAFPLSGQYGPGSRILYYVLVAACLLARKTEWLRNACLAAALIFPAIAAIHGIVLASLHVDGAVDMDIFGAFQFCSIGILTAPATVRLSRTYFNNPGRNILFVWTMLILAGLIALTVEFFRSHSVPCTDDGSGMPLHKGARFPYGDTLCGLTCSIDDGPWSPMRTGSADDIYVVPEPGVLTFGAATLVAAACCIPGILSMVSIWDKILRTNFAKQFSGLLDADELIEGTNGATPRKMKTVNDVIRRLLSVVEIPVFASAVLALIIVGELNFWSAPVRYHTESPSNVGQWHPIVGSVLAACGSLYMLVAKDLETAEQETANTPQPVRLCHCSCHGGYTNRPGSLSDNTDADNASPIARPASAEIARRDTFPIHRQTPTRTDTVPDREEDGPGLGIHTVDSSSSATGSRREVTRALMRFANAFGTVSPDRFDDYDFRHGKATGFPVIPGEENRNSKLRQIKEQWGQPNPDDDALTPRGRRSRANSFNGSVSGAAGISRSNSAIGLRGPSPHPPSKSAAPPGLSSSFLLGLPTTASPESTGEPVFPARGSAELEKARSQSTVVTLHQGPNSPAIVLSSEDGPDDASSADVPSPPEAERPPS